MAMVANNKTVLIAANGNGNSQHNSNAKKVIGAIKERLRLSNNFQRPTHDTASAPENLPNIQGNSCQSPLVQRCCRFSNTS